MTTFQIGNIVRITRPATMIGGRMRPATVKTARITHMRQVEDGKTMCTGVDLAIEADNARKIADGTLAYALPAASFEFVIPHDGLHIELAA